MEPLVSFIVNCYNGELYLKRCLDSILTQTYQNWELIFWDNASTDHSKEIFTSYGDKRFKYFNSDVKVSFRASESLGGRCLSWRLYLFFRC